MRYLFLLLLVWYCSDIAFAQQQNTLSFEQITQAVQQQQFQIRFRIASTHSSFYLNPTTPYIDQNINISPDSSFVVIADSVAVGYLPYYGSGYAFPQYGLKGVVFKNRILNRQIHYNTKGHHPSISFQFEILGLLDSYKIQIDITKNGTTYMLVISRQRSPISYIGSFELLPINQISTSDK